MPVLMKLPTTQIVGRRFKFRQKDKDKKFGHLCSDISLSLGSYFV